MWMLLQQVTQSEAEGLDEVVVYWNEEASDIPEESSQLIVLDTRIQS